MTIFLWRKRSLGLKMFYSVSVYINKIVKCFDLIFGLSWVSHYLEWSAILFSNLSI